MSQFYGTLKGQAGKATRRGSKNSGLSAVGASWNGAIEVQLTHSNGKDYFTVYQIKWQGAGIHEQIAHGKIGEPIS